MKTLISILKEEKEEKSSPPKDEKPKKTLEGSILTDTIVALMSGRPSEEIKNLKGKAESAPEELLKSIGLNSYPSTGSKIKNLEKIFSTIISGQNVPDDHPAKGFTMFFEAPQKVVSPNGTAPGLLIKLTKSSKEAIQASGSVKKSLRIFSFWFASIVTSINNVNSDYFKIDTNRFKFQFASGQQAILIYVSSGKSWKNL